MQLREGLSQFMEFRFEARSYPTLSNPVASRCAITTSVTINPDIAGAILKHAGTATHGDAGQKTQNDDLIALATIKKP